MTNEKGEIVKLLKSIDSKLDTLITLSRLTVPKQTPTEEEKKVLKFCNRKNSVLEIMKQTEKTRTAVDNLLSNMRLKGIIKSVTLSEKDPSTKKPKVVYVRA